MSSITQEARYHVVCRDCSVERLFEAGADADALEIGHAAETGHEVVVGRVR